MSLWSTSIRPRPKRPAPRSSLTRWRPVAPGTRCVYFGLSDIGFSANDFFYRLLGTVAKPVCWRSDKLFLPSSTRLPRSRLLLNRFLTPFPPFALAIRTYAPGSIQYFPYDIMHHMLRNENVIFQRTVLFLHSGCCRKYCVKNITRNSTLPDGAQNRQSPLLTASYSSTLTLHPSLSRSVVQYHSTRDPTEKCHQRISCRSRAIKTYITL